MEQLATCANTYPDGSALSCLEDVPTAGPQPLDGWTCIEAVAGRMVSLWTDGDGAYAIRFEHPSKDGFVSHVGLQAGEARQEASFHHDRLAVHRFDGRFQGPVTWQVATYWFEGRLQAEGWSAPLDVRVSRYEGDPWYLWVFEAPDGTTYSTHSMQRFRLGSDAHWLPVGLRMQGEGYDLQVTLDQVMQANATSVEPSSALPGILPPPERCPPEGAAGCVPACTELIPSRGARRAPAMAGTND